MTNYLCGLAGSSESCFRAFANILKLQCYLMLLLSESSAERQSAWSSVLSKVYQNPYYFYNLNPSPLNPAFNRLPAASSPAIAFSQPQKPIFSVQLRPVDQPQDSSLPNSQLPSRFFYTDPLPPASNPYSLLYHHQHENRLPSELSKPTNQYDRRNPLFQHRVGTVSSENGGLPSDLLDQRLDFHGETAFAVF